MNLKRDLKETRVIIVILAVMFAIQTFLYCNEVNSCETTDYIEHFLKNYPKRTEKALKLMPVINAESEKWDIDPLLVAVIISLESSFKQTARGSIGERGLMQVLPHGACGKGQDLKTPEGQIKAGVRCLAIAREYCGNDMERYLTMYASGKCTTKSKRTKRVINRRMRIYAKWRSGQN